MKRYLCLFTILIIVVILGLYKCGIAFYEYTGPTNGAFEATIENIGKETKYMRTYIVCSEKRKFIAYVKKSNKLFEIGDIVRFNGEFIQPDKSRNEGGYNYKLYLKTKKIFGSFKIQNIEKIGKSSSVIYNWKRLVFNIKYSIKASAEKNLKKENTALLMGILIGDTDELSNEIEDNFKKASLTHVLAISGSNFSYIILILNYANKLGKNKKLGQITTILCILFFMELTGNTASVVRAGVMAILIIVAKLTHRKYDIWTSMAVSTLIQIIHNPYCIFDLGLILSYGGVAGLLLFYNRFKKIIKSKLVSATVSANILIIPIMMYNFNTISLSFIISNIATTMLIEVITIVGIISIVLRVKIIYTILDVCLGILNSIVKICAQIPFSQIYVTTPALISILFYYIILGVMIGKTNCKKTIAILTVLAIVFNINFPMIKITIKNELLINFVDVGQGDCTLIRKGNKTVLIDGGGGTDESYDIGEKILIPYLLYKKVKKIDYMIVSHFDSDHVRWITYCDGKNACKTSHHLQTGFRL